MNKESFIVELFGEKIDILNYKPKILTEDEVKELEKVEDYSKLYEYFSNKNKKYLDDHYNTLDILRNGLFSKAMKNENPFCDECNKVIDLCKKDLLNAPYLIDMWTRLHGKEVLQRTFYGTNQYLIKMLENQGKYKEAIQYCDVYINLGLDFDNTKGGIKGRKEKLLKRLP